MLDALIDGGENEVVEFKEAGRDFDTDRIGRYVCALSNEANLGGAPAGWLVFGVRNKTLSVVGTDYRSDPARLNGIKAQVADGTEPSLTFRSVRIVDHSGCRVVLFEVPPVPQGLPIAWKGHCNACAKESLKPFTIDKLDAIRREGSAMDWTAQPVPDSEMSYLSPEALRVARGVEKYDQKSVLETMYNCTAYQDHSQASRASVSEYPDRLEFVSVGSLHEERAQRVRRGRPRAPAPPQPRTCASHDPAQHD